MAWPYIGIYALETGLARSMCLKTIGIPRRTALPMADGMVLARKRWHLYPAYIVGVL